MALKQQIRICTLEFVEWLVSLDPVLQVHLAGKFLHEHLSSSIILAAVFDQPMDPKLCLHTLEVV